MWIISLRGFFVFFVFFCFFFEAISGPDMKFVIDPAALAIDRSLKTKQDP
jgi:hypothetical protein